MRLILAAEALGTLCTFLLLVAQLPSVSAAAGARTRPRNRISARYLSPSPRTELEPFLANPPSPSPSPSPGSPGEGAGARLLTATSSGLPCDPQLAMPDSFVRQDLLDLSARRAGDVVELDWSAVASSGSPAGGHYTLRIWWTAAASDGELAPWAQRAVAVDTSGTSAKLAYNAYSDDALQLKVLVNDALGPLTVEERGLPAGTRGFWMQIDRVQGDTDTGTRAAHVFVQTQKCL